jgi:hypothetical protein
MSRLFNAMGLVLAALAGNMSTGAVAQDAYLTRIEPRPFYGATVTIEEGVRVFRPLPSTRQMIINPSQVPLNLSFSESVERHSTSHNSASPANGAYATNETSDNGSAADDASGSLNGSDGNRVSADSDTGFNNLGANKMRGRKVAGHGVRVNGRHAAVYTASTGYQRVGMQSSATRGGKLVTRVGYLAAMPTVGHAKAGVRVHRPMVQQHAAAMMPPMMRQQLHAHRMLHAPAPLRAAPVRAAPMQGSSFVHPGHANAARVQPSHGHYRQAPAGRMGMGRGH